MGLISTLFINGTLLDAVKLNANGGLRNVDRFRGNNAPFVEALVATQLTKGVRLGARRCSFTVHRCRDGEANVKGRTLLQKIPLLTGCTLIGTVLHI